MKSFTTSSSIAKGIEKCSTIALAATICQWDSNIIESFRAKNDQIQNGFGLFGVEQFTFAKANDEKKDETTETSDKGKKAEAFRKTWLIKYNPSRQQAVDEFKHQNSTPVVRCTRMQIVDFIQYMIEDLEFQNEEYKRIARDLISQDEDVKNLFQIIDDLDDNKSEFEVFDEQSIRRKREPNMTRKKRRKRERNLEPNMTRGHPLFLLDIHGKSIETIIPDLNQVRDKYLQSEQYKKVTICKKYSKDDMQKVSITNVQIADLQRDQDPIFFQRHNYNRQRKVYSDRYDGIRKENLPVPASIEEILQLNNYDFDSLEKIRQGLNIVQRLMKSGGDSIRRQISYHLKKRLSDEVKILYNKKMQEYMWRVLRTEVYKENEQQMQIVDMCLCLEKENAYNYTYHYYDDDNAYHYQDELYYDDDNDVDGGSERQVFIEEVPKIHPHYLNEKQVSMQKKLLVDPKLKLIKNPREQIEQKWNCQIKQKLDRWQQTRDFFSVFGEGRNIEKVPEENPIYLKYRKLYQFGREQKYF